MPPYTSVDCVTLCWFDGAMNWGKIGILRDGVEMPWLDGKTPPETIPGNGGPFKYRKEKIPTGTIHQWDAAAARGDFPIRPGDKLFVYVILDSKDPPVEVLLQLRANGSYDHRAFWGTTNKVTHMESPLVAALPAGGTWTRLEVDPGALGVGGKPKR